MGKLLKIPFDVAIREIEREKHWTAGPYIDWVQTSVNRWPFAFKHRSVLRVGDRMAEGLFIQLEYKAGTIENLPERIYFGLHVGGARTFAVDEDGVTGHTNKVGRGMPFYQQRVGHPHIHLPVLESSYGYVEPLDRCPVEELWQLFLERANIHGAPPLNLPGADSTDVQLRLI
jgi:hypothetical protein